jgi:uncharacterized repeat protein (TIGR01451 family)
VSGGSYSISWLAADPALNRGPLAPTYEKLTPAEWIAAKGSYPTGISTDPLTGAEAYASPAIRSNEDGVTSLAPKDLALGQIVPFFLEVTVTGDTSAENGSITINPYWLTKTTSGDDFGFDPDHMLLAAFVDSGDPAHLDADGKARVSSFSSVVEKANTSNEQIVGTVNLTGLNKGDRVIVELWVALKSDIPAGAGGNVQTGLVGASTAAGDRINAGNQTLPLLQVQDFFKAVADVRVVQSDNLSTLLTGDDADPVLRPGDSFTYTIQATNNSTGTTANGVVLTQALDPNLTFVSATGGGTLGADGKVTWNLLSLSPQEVQTVTVTVQVKATAPTAGVSDLRSTATITSITVDSNPANNTSMEPTDLLPAQQPATGTVTGTVWTDADHDGQRAVSEPLVAGATVELLQGTTVIGRTVTDAAGTYSFTGLAAGNYAVRVVAPAGQSFTLQDSGADATDSDVSAADGVATFTLAAGATVVRDAGVYAPVTLGGSVFLDAGADGQQVGDVPLSGVTVQLLDAAGGVLATTTTDGSGLYRFVDRAPGEYVVRVIAPDGTVFTQGGVGPAATDSDVDGSGLTRRVTLASGESADLDAGVYAPARIGGTAFADSNADGSQSGEVGLAAVTVELLSGGRVVASTETDGNGSYAFEGLTPGMYVVRFVAPDGTRISPSGAAPEDSDSDADPSTGLTTDVTLGSGGSADLDAGFFRTASVGDRVWCDANGNGLQDAGEAGLRGVTMRLLDAAGAVVATTVSSLTGSYRFDDLLPGSYAVEFVAPAGLAFTTQDAGANAADRTDSDAGLLDGRTATFTLRSGERNSTIDAGLVRTGSIGNLVWADRDGDGVQDPDEPGLRNVKVKLLNADGVAVATTITDASGFYLFDGIRPGTYGVQFVTPAGHTPSPADVGDDAADSDAGAGGRTGPVAVAAGQVVTSVDAGFVPASVGACDLPVTLLSGRSDAFPGTEGGDHVDGLGGNDNINGLRGDDCLRGNDGDDAINGHEGNDRIQGDGGDDNLHGNGGRDVIFGGKGNDTIEAGEDADWAEGGAGNDAMQGEGGNDTLLGGAGRDTVEGNGGDDVVLGNAGNDRVAGHDGNDLLAGGADDGRARLNAAGGIAKLVIGDTVSGDGGADRFVWQRGDGVDMLLDFRPAEGDTLTIHGYAGFTAIGQVDGRTVLYLDTDSAIVLNDAYPAIGLAGPFPGITFLPGSDAAPELPAERAPIAGGMGANRLVGTAAPDAIDGLHGNDTLLGLDGRDTLDGGYGDDLLEGGLEADLLNGGAGTDTAGYADAAGPVTASLAKPGGNAGAAMGDVYLEIENLLGSAFGDRLGGDGGANRIAGGAGKDTLSGGGGQDSLVGGLGADSLVGGAGADRFVFLSAAESPASTPDVIADFSWAQEDRIDLSAIDANAAQGGDQAFIFIGNAAFTGDGRGAVRWEHRDGDTRVEIDLGDGGAAEMAVVLTGLHTVTGKDFVL